MGVVHRDVKPGNIMRSDDGAVKLADFGIAKAMVGGTSQITQAGSVLGTAAYLAPEQASGAEVGPPADLYGLGVVTYQLLAGRLPYDAGSLTELAMMQQREYPIRLDEVAPEVPAALALAVEKALALAPGDRYPSADEMRTALHQGARGIAPAGAEDTAADRAARTRRADGGDAGRCGSAARRAAAAAARRRPARGAARVRADPGGAAVAARPAAAAARRGRPGPRGRAGRRARRCADRVRDRELAGRLVGEAVACRW